MSLLLIILFIAMPFVEIALLMQLGGWLGFWPTIGLVVVTAIVGAYVLQAQGVATMHKIAQSIGSGEPPIAPVLDGFFLAISGAFLLTPGVVTDAIGLLLLVPPVRHVLARWGFGQLLKRANFTVHTYSSSSSSIDPDDAMSSRGQHQKGNRSSPGPGGRPTRGQGTSSGPVIDGDYEEVKKK